MAKGPSPSSWGTSWELQSHNPRLPRPKPVLLGQWVAWRLPNQPPGPGTEPSPLPTWLGYWGSASRVPRAPGNRGVSGGPSPWQMRGLDLRKRRQPTQSHRACRKQSGNRVSSRAGGGPRLRLPSRSPSVPRRRRMCKFRGRQKACPQ